MEEFPFMEVMISKVELALPNQYLHIKETCHLFQMMALLVRKIDYREAPTTAPAYPGSSYNIGGPAM